MLKHKKKKNCVTAAKMKTFRNASEVEIERAYYKVEAK